MTNEVGLTPEQIAELEQSVDRSKVKEVSKKIVALMQEAGLNPIEVLFLLDEILSAALIVLLFVSVLILAGVRRKND